MWVIQVGQLPRTLEAGWRADGRTILVAEDMLDEDPRVVAAALVHELAHAEQARQARERPEMVTQDCVDREVAAHQDQVRVWALAWPEGEMPRRTKQEARFTDLAEHEMAEPGVSMERWVLRQAWYRRACDVAE